jgi:putative flippase GtrA
LRSWPPWLSRLIRYGLVGGTGVIVNFGILKAVWPFLHDAPAVANAVATEAAILSNYALNSRFTFRTPLGWGTWFRYNLVSLLGGALQVGVFTLLVHLHVYYLLANLLAIPLNTIVGFLLSTHWAFKPSLANAEPALETSQRGR